MLSSVVDDSDNFISNPLQLFESLEWNLSPWADYYSSPLNHINLFQVIDPKQISAFEFVLVRDGLFSLMDFFNRFPEPLVFSNIFIVHISLKEFVPEKWNKKIIFFDYEIDHSAFNQNVVRDRLIVKGLLKKGVFDLESFKKNLNNIIQYTQFKKMLICLPPRQNVFLNDKWNGDSIYATDVSELMKYLHCELASKIDMELISWDNFFFIPDLHSYSFYDANTKSSVYIDDHTTFFLLKRGAMPLFLNKTINPNPDDLVVPLTYVHNIRVYKSVPSSPKLYPEIQAWFKSLDVSKNEKLSKNAFEVLHEYGKAHLQSLPF